MTSFSNPTLFSTHYCIAPALLEQEGLVDPFIDVDTQLFIDPILLAKSATPVIKKEAVAAFREHFSNFIRLLLISETRGDVAWRTAEQLLNLDEPPQNGLGYGGSGQSGSSRPDTIRDAIMRTSKEIVKLGSKDPEMISLMGFFEDDVGPDTISDFTTRVIIKQLASLTEDFCKRNGVPIFDSEDVEGFKLPRHKKKTGKLVSIVLVPRDIVRDLPIAKDWSDIEKAALHNARIRKEVNKFLGGITRPTVVQRKSAMRKVALRSADDLALFIMTVKENVSHYDPNLDAFAYYKLRSILTSDASHLKRATPYDLSQPDSLKALVIDTLQQFKHHVEKGNLWEELWIGGEPKKERAAQLIYYAIADTFCRVNNVDISPEANMGGGPIDFKFSKGYEARVLVEIKRSSGTVVHGYDKQLEIYKEASRTNYGIFVVMDYGDLGTKLAQIRTIQKARLERGEKASDIIIIDAKKKISASKRK